MQVSKKNSEKWLNPIKILVNFVFLTFILMIVTGISAGIAGVGTEGLIEDASQIMLIRRDDLSEYRRLEIEIQTCPTIKDQLTIEHVISFGSTLITHLQYMINLIQVGFQLVVVEDACVWSLGKVFRRQLDDSVLGLVNPLGEC